MADKRMFAKSITESDAFTDMPSTAQALYFHLNQNADDDGFNNQVNHAIINAHASPDDLKLLLVKKFVIRFESGVIVIKHWRIHNTIQRDRYKPTNFQEEMAMLGVKDNKAYTLNDDAELIEIADDVEEPQKAEMTPARQKRAEAYKESDLPYSFTYKIKNAFVGERCPICGVKMGMPDRDPNDPVVGDGRTTQPTIQHNLPISMGGKHDIDNISVICGRCNASVQANPTGKLNNDMVKQKWAQICNSIGIGSGLETQIREDKNRLDKYREDISPSNDGAAETEKRPVASLSKTQQSRFDAFWKIYPKKVGKQDAMKAWKKIAPDEELTNTIITAVETAKAKDSRFREERFIPHPATWLNAGSWDDEFDDYFPVQQEPKPTPAPTAQRPAQRPAQTGDDSLRKLDVDDFLEAAVAKTRRGG